MEREKKRYTFRDCTRAKLEDLFGIRRTWQSSVLEHWLQMRPSLEEREKIVLESYQTLLLLGSDVWNERDLALNFIGPTLGLAKFMEPYRFNLFAERKIGAEIAGVEFDVELSGEPDGMIATGYWEPKVPMFAFSEYKRTLDPHGDPAGQALAAMLVAQKLNKNTTPIYGCYIIGQQWHFLVLEDKHYTISRAFLAETEDIFEIFRVLKALKLIIMELTA
ncbi:MAG: hypothetical protein AAF639_12025 [Chloroflexota bacterium]